MLFWGRRDDPASSMNEHSGTPHVWDPVTGPSVATPQPRRADGTTVNLFCAGHAYLPDGRLLVAGGHLTDGDGIDYAGTYDHATNTWTPLPDMNGGRWYPTATSLADGRVLVISGSAAAHGTIEVNADPADHRRRELGADRRLRRAAALPAHARRPGRPGPHGGLATP